MGWFSYMRARLAQGYSVVEDRDWVDYDIQRVAGSKRLFDF